MRGDGFDIAVGPYGMTEVTFYDIDFHPVPPPYIKHVFAGGGSKGTRVVSIEDSYGEVIADAYITNDGDRKAAGRWLMDMVVIRGSNANI